MNYEKLLQNISTTYTSGQSTAIQAVNHSLIKTYWEIGQHIVEFEQSGTTYATYGTGLLKTISKDLKHINSKGFSVSNLQRMRQFYVEYPNYATLSHKLNWSHIIELLKIDDPLERSFYEQQTALEKWSVRELVRQKKSGLFLRLAVSKDKNGILELAKQGQLIEKPSDIIREPYILDFLQIPEPYQLNETELEKRLVSSLQNFLLELGKGFAFIGRQYRITLGNRHHYVDLVFYHRILKCFVLIDLKINEAGYNAVGQMNMYLSYFENEENVPDDNPPIGIILARSKDELLIKYALHHVSSQLFVAKYQLYLPNREELQQLIEQRLNDNF